MRQAWGRAILQLAGWVVRQSRLLGAVTGWVQVLTLQITEVNEEKNGLGDHVYDLK